MLKLHLGCGPKRLDGFVNIDFNQGDVEHDLTTPLPYEDGSADEVHAYHVFEHFYRYEADRILDDWTRVLKPGGLMVLELPCFDKLMALFNAYIDQRKPIPFALMCGLYGDPTTENPFMCHRWAYSVSELRQMMERAGMSVTVHEPQTHIKARDMRLEGIKHAAPL